jgi:predicted dehydrogenase
MQAASTVRWGIIGTANIARSSFLPGLREAGEGVAEAVAGRDLERTRRYAAENGVARAIQGYESLLEDENIDAVYIALPNTLHAEWTMAALRAGKAVLCEKPLCTTAQETEMVLQVARETEGLLWEAFVFPFHTQTIRLQEVVAAGRVGEVHEVQSNFHFMLRNRNNIRLDPDLAGGSLYDVGCYCVRLARLVLQADPTDAEAMARWDSSGVDGELTGILRYAGERFSTVSSGLYRARDTFSRVLGTEGETRLSNPFHPLAHDTLEIRVDGRIETERLSSGEPPFTPAIRHIHAVLRGEAPPEHLAVDEALGNAQAIDALYASAGRQ